jgi:bifunctional DNase/RNase
MSFSGNLNRFSNAACTQKERPLTHDLLANVLRALGAKIDRVILNDLKDGTYFAKLLVATT